MDLHQGNYKFYTMSLFNIADTSQGNYLHAKYLKTLYVLQLVKLQLVNVALLVVG